MADNISGRESGSRYPGGDPFAELSRIISGGQAGHDDAPGRNGYEPEPDFDLDMDMEREVLGSDRDGFEEDAYPDPAASPAAPVHAAPAGEAEPFYDPLADEFADAFAAEFNSGGNREEPAAAVEQGQTAQQWRDFAPAETPPMPAEAALAEVDMDFGDLDLTDDMPALEAGDAETRYDDARYDEPAAAATGPAGHAAAPPSIEDELEAMLTGGEPAAYDEPYREPAPAYAPQHSGPAADDGWERPVETAGFEPRHDTAPYDAAPGGYDDPSAYDDEYGATAFDAVREEIAADAGYDEPLAGQPQDLHPEPAREPDPFAVFAAMAPAAPVIARSSQAPVSAPQQPVAQEDEGFDTVGVAEAAVPVQDDLDIPDFDYQEETPPAPALDAEFDLGELHLSEPAYAAPAAGEPGPAHAGYDDQWFASGDAAAAPAHADDALYAEYAGYQAEGAEAYDDQETVALAQPYAEQAEPKKRNTGLIAAAVAGVVVLGGIGAFALSFGGGGSNEGSPTLVRADSEPLKVKPENPGGTIEPANQDSQTYRRVAEGQAETQPQQENLVSTTEQPVNLAERALPANGLPGVEDEIDRLDAAPLPKDEDRIAATEDALGVGANDDLIAVQPRRVRTMIVRPDGTLVPREEAPLVAAVTEDALPASDALPLGDGADAADAEVPLPSEMLSPLPQGTDSAVGGGMPAARTVETVRITPESQNATPPAAEQPAPAADAAPDPAPVAAPAPRPAETQVAQAQAPARNQPAAPPAPAAAAGEWSMQIASQPTAEGAQTTYQDLARRYGSVIGGRGVNIVKADIPGKGTYYRVRIPSPNRADAIQLCERYKSAGGSCFVSR